MSSKEKSDFTKSSDNDSSNNESKSNDSKSISEDELKTKEYSMEKSQINYKYRYKAGKECKQKTKQQPKPHDEPIPADIAILRENFIKFITPEEVKSMYERLKNTYKFEMMSCPKHVNDQILYLYNDGNYNASVLMREFIPKKKTNKKQQNLLKPTIIANPNVLDGVINTFCPSSDGEYVAYSLRNNNKRRENIYVKCLIPNLNSINDYEVVQNVDFTSIAWSRDNNGFFYSFNYRYTKSHSLIYYFEFTRLPTEKLVLDFYEQPFWRFKLHVSENGEYLIIIVTSDKPGNLIYYAKIPNDYEIIDVLPYVQVVRKWKRSYKYVTSYGSKMIFITDRFAPNRNLIEIDFHNRIPKCHCGWKLKLPEKKDAILMDVVSYKKFQYFCHYLQYNGSSSFSIYHIDDKTFEIQYEFKFNNLLITEITTNKNNIVYIKYESFSIPPIVERLEFSNKNSIPKREILKNSYPSGYNDYKYLVEHYTEKNLDIRIDGKIKNIKSQNNDENLKINRTKFCLMIVNGGFGELNIPKFNPCLFEFLRMYDICIAHIIIPGGGEKGRLWHKNGKLHNKSKFLKLIPNAVNFIKTKYSNEIILYGYYNGGLITASCLFKTPNLFCGALCIEPYTQLIEKFDEIISKTGDYVINEYGNSINCEFDKKKIIEYEPLTLLESNKNLLLTHKCPPIFIRSSLYYDKITFKHGLELINKMLKIFDNDFTKVGPYLFTSCSVTIAYPASINDIIERYCEEFVFMNKYVMKN